MSSFCQRTKVRLGHFFRVGVCIKVRCYFGTYKAEFFVNLVVRAFHSAASVHFYRLSRGRVVTLFAESKEVIFREDSVASITPNKTKNGQKSSNHE